MEQSFHWTGLVGLAVIGLTIGNIIGVVRDGRPAGVRFLTRMSDR